MLTETPSDASTVTRAVSGAAALTAVPVSMRHSASSAEVMMTDNFPDIITELPFLPIFMKIN